MVTDHNMSFLVLNVCKANGIGIGTDNVIANALEHPLERSVSDNWQLF